MWEGGFNIGECDYVFGYVCLFVSEMNFVDG